jgi:hypothetical protein
VFVTHDQEEALTMSDRIARDARSGKILQIGTPARDLQQAGQRIVSSPTSSAKSTYSRERVERTDGDLATVRLRDGSMVSAHLGTASARSGDVSVAMRPENVRLASAGETPTLTGVLENIVYFGAATNLHLRLGTGEEIVIRNPGAVDEGRLPAWRHDRRHPATRPDPGAGMSGREPPSALAAAIDQNRRNERVTRAWLLAPALTIILAISILPLGITVVYSFLTPGTYGGVTWEFSTDSYVQFLFQRDIFDDTLVFNSAYVSIFLRSIGLALGATIGALILGFPTAYFIASKPREQRNIWLFLITLPFWTNLLIRTYAMLLIIRDEGIITSC